MTDTSIAAHFATNDFRVGSVVRRSGAVLSRHFLPFFLVAAIAGSPTLLIASMQMIASMQTTEPIEPSEALSQDLWAMLGVVLGVVLSQLLAGIILHAAFQEMRRRPVRLVESFKVGLSRFVPLVGIAFVQGFLILLGMFFLSNIGLMLSTYLPLVGISFALTLLEMNLLIIPGLILYTMWFLGLPACVVERLGPWTSFRRSQELTKGYRWKIFALALLFPVLDAGGSHVIVPVLALAGPIAGLTGQLIWTGLTAAFLGIIIAVTYYDLRVIKEGVDIDQITAVFE